MSEISIHVVYDTETFTFRVEGTDSMPVDSDEYVWDKGTEEWRVPTDEEQDLAIDAEAMLAGLLKPREYCNAPFMASSCTREAGHAGDHEA